MRLFVITGSAIAAALRPLSESKPLNQLIKNLAQMIKSGGRRAKPNLVQIRPRGSEGLLRKYVKYNIFNFLYL